MSPGVDLKGPIEGTRFRGRKEAEEGKMVGSEESRYNVGSEMSNADQEQEGRMKRKRMSD